MPDGSAAQGLARRLRGRGSELKLSHRDESSKQAEANFGDNLTMPDLQYLACSVVRAR
jgi:hypothetical protein